MNHRIYLLIVDSGRLRQLWARLELVYLFSASCYRAIGLADDMILVEYHMAKALGQIKRLLENREIIRCRTVGSCCQRSREVVHAESPAVHLGELDADGASDAAQRGKAGAGRWGNQEAGLREHYKSGGGLMTCPIGALRRNAMARRARIERATKESARPPIVGAYVRDESHFVSDAERTALVIKAANIIKNVSISASPNYRLQWDWGALKRMGQSDEVIG
jgi:hypothetical protein